MERASLKTTIEVGSHCRDLQAPDTALTAKRPASSTTLSSGTPNSPIWSSDYTHRKLENILIYTNKPILNNSYINQITMEIEGEVPTKESEARSLVRDSFKREDYRSLVPHSYNLCTLWLIQIAKVFLLPIFPQSSGKSKKTKENRWQWKKSNFVWVTVLKCRLQQHRREWLHRPQQSQTQQTD